MSDDVLIKAEGASKKFCRSLKRSLWYGLKDIANEAMARNGRHDQLRPEEFWAVNDVSFELRRGECLGLIGRNGAGKTTLLKLLNGLIKPDKGRIVMRGRVGALIALGAGFNPILTGRENIYVNASVLGLTKKQTDEKFDEIVDFAELGEFIDAPVQSYSSGMQVRLGFAVATVLEPDILLLDEVLAVGDASFRNKCYHRVASLRKKAAVIFVSHNMDQIARTSSHTLVMDSGIVAFMGSVVEGAKIYEQLNVSEYMVDSPFLSIYPPITDFQASLSQFQLVSGEPLDINFRVTSNTDLSNFLMKVFFYNTAGAFAADGAFYSNEYRMSVTAGINNFRLSLISIPLKNGKYYVAFNLIDQFGDLIVWSFKRHEIIIHDAYAGAIADCQLQAFR